MVEWFSEWTTIDHEQLSVKSSDLVKFFFFYTNEATKKTRLSPLPEIERLLGILPWGPPLEPALHWKISMLCIAILTGYLADCMPPSLVFKRKLMCAATVANKLFNILKVGVYSSCGEARNQTGVQTQRLQVFRPKQVKTAGQQTHA